MEKAQDNREVKFSRCRMAENIPSTISAKAQEYLKIGLIFATDPARPDWPRIREYTNKLYAKINDQAKEMYLESAEEADIAGVPVTIGTPRNFDWARESKVIYYTHGGGYVQSDPHSSCMIWAPLAFRSGLRLYAVDYRLAPEHPYPAAPDDCYVVYKQLIKKFKAKDIVLFGDSAGGALALITALRAHREGLPLPGAMLLSSPWADITKTGDSYFTNEGLDAIIHYEMNLRGTVDVYAGKRDLSDPEISPVYGKYTGEFPPTMILTGTRDLFLSNCTRLYRVMKKAGMKVELNVFEGMWHDFIGWADLPETEEAHREMAAFISEHLK